MYNYVCNVAEVTQDSFESVHASNTSQAVQPKRRRTDSLEMEAEEGATEVAKPSQMADVNDHFDDTTLPAFAEVYCLLFGLLGCK